MRSPLFKVFASLGAAVLAVPGAKALDDPEFQELHAQLQRPADEAWRKLPWKLSLLEARAEAEKAKRPVYMLVRSGHPLGCV